MTPLLRLRLFASLLILASIRPAAALAQTSSRHDLAVNYIRLSLPQVAAAQTLEYTVRFQNTGADTASTLTVIDLLDATKLNPASLQLVGSSHNCTWRFDSGHILNASFSGIQLPPASTDSIQSRGFIRFRVQPLTTLVTGDTIFNTAIVTFDANTPAVTNTVFTVIGNPTGLPAPTSSAAWSAYPNPTTGPLTITADLPTAGPVRLELLDLLGRSLQQHQLAVPAGAFRQSLEMAAVPAGIYVLRFQLPDGRVTTRRIVRR